MKIYAAKKCWHLVLLTAFKEVKAVVTLSSSKPRPEHNRYKNGRPYFGIFFKT
jgi:hypothetical protein